MFVAATSRKRLDTVGELVSVAGAPPFRAIERSCGEQANIEGGEHPSPSARSQGISPTDEPHAGRTIMEPKYRAAWASIGSVQTYFRSSV